MNWSLHEETGLMLLLFHTEEVLPLVDYFLSQISNSPTGILGLPLRIELCHDLFPLHGFESRKSQRIIYALIFFFFFFFFLKRKCWYHFTFNHDMQKKIINRYIYRKD